MKGLLDDVPSASYRNGPDGWNNKKFGVLCIIHHMPYSLLVSYTHYGYSLYGLAHTIEGIPIIVFSYTHSRDMVLAEGLSYIWIMVPATTTVKQTNTKLRYFPPCANDLFPPAN